jgi:putative transposase
MVKHGLLVATLTSLQMLKLEASSLLKLRPLFRPLFGVVTNKHYFSLMADINVEHNVQFFTATILEWKTLLTDDAFKDIIINSLLFLKNEKSIVVYAFVLMPNHIHLIWQIQDGYKPNVIQQRFLKFTAQQMKFRLLDTNDTQLENFKVKAKDRQYQFWERNAHVFDLWSPKLIIQKLDYIHNNPLQEKWQLVELAENYKYSSARFYETGVDGFGLLTHHEG